MSDIEQRIRDRAYQLWEQAGRPTEHSDQFWFAARQEIEGGTPPVGDQPGNAIDTPPEERTLEKPPEVAAQQGEPVGQPGERIAEPGVPDDRLAEAAAPAGAANRARAARTTPPGRKTAESENAASPRR